MSKIFKPRTLTLLRYNLRCNEREHESTIPTVTLAGKWMYEAGFRSGQKIRIIVQERELIIHIESEPAACPPEKKSVINRDRRQVYRTPTLEPEEEPFRPRKPKRKKEQRKQVLAE